MTKAKQVSDCDSAGNSATLIYHLERSKFENRYPWVDIWCAMSGMDQIIVDRAAMAPRSVPSFTDLASALQHVDGRRLVWLDHKATRYLDQHDHKPGDVYVLGSDEDGFDEVGGPKGGVCVKIRDGCEMHASMIVPLICYDQKLFSSGRRKRRR